VAAQPGCVLLTLYGRLAVVSLVLAGVLAWWVSAWTGLVLALVAACMAAVELLQ
jgi:hypothetical protein